MEEEESSFSVAHEKIMAHPIASLFWSHTMDLLGVIYADSNGLEVYRISLKMQLILKIKEPRDLLFSSFSPDSKRLAYITDEGTLCMTCIETSESTYRYKLPVSSLTTLLWTDYTLFNDNILERNTLLDSFSNRHAPSATTDKKLLHKVNHYDDYPE